MMKALVAGCLSKKRSGKKMYMCPIEDCEKIFPDQGSFRKHQITHGERLFICPVD
jgi:hypothetical protein